MADKKPKPKTKKPKTTKPKAPRITAEDRKRIFVGAYLQNPNATQAAIAAGFSEKTAKQAGTRMLSDATVREMIEKGRRAAELRTGVTVDRIRLELARIAFANLDDVASWGTAGDRSYFTLKASDQVDPDVIPAVQSIKVKRKFVSNPDVDEDGEPLPPIEVEETEVKMADKLKALELLGKHNGMFEQKIAMKLDVPLDLSKLSLEDRIKLEALLNAASPDE